ncbi:sensor histidine kinase [Cohnella candidum]|uniref:histidine kinase n=1 Tax=Cohnella candidum TaxID=2674991 RepID=A0A3G3K287_9BACL|nr:HAMP domain-containing sensor histidine kinase [Cohnella candidum]AYQ74552.1 sensor histidine kinase [Cohnella candidum]
MIRNLRVGTKIQLHNLFLIATVILVTAFSFQVLSERYLLKEAKAQLKSDAEAIVFSLKGTPVLSGRIIAERIVNRAKFKLVGRAISSRLLILDKSNRVIYSNADSAEVEVLRGLTKSNDQGYLVQRREILSENGQLLGRIVLAVQIREVQGFNRILRGAEWVSALIGGLFAMVMGFLLGKTITRPLGRLAAGMRKFTPKQNVPAIGIASRDEIGELAESFSTMAAEIRSHDRVQTEFLQNASHELKTPLMTIQGNAEAIKDGIVQGEEAGQSLDLIVSECQRLKGIVDELIYLTRLEQVSEAYRFERLRIGDVLLDAIERLRAVAEQKGIELRVEGELDREGNYDSEKLMRAMLNIAGNGIRYAGSFVRLKVSAEGNATIIICEDDGKGFAPGEENKVFDRFYKGQQGGTGIGLSMAKAIVEAHGGTIEALPGKPNGAVFRLRLP